MDFSILSDRIAAQRKTAGFYTTAVEMLINQFEYHTFYPLDELKARFPLVSSEFFEQFILGEVTERMVMGQDESELDNFIQEALFACGFVYGISELKKEEGDTSSYIAQLYQLNDEPHLVPVAYAFAAMTLAMQRPPSAAMLLRFAPPTKDDQTNMDTFDFITEMNVDLVVKYRKFGVED